MQAASKGLVPQELRSRFSSDITRGEFCTVLTQVLVQKDFAAYYEYKYPDDPPFTDSHDPNVWWLNSLGVVSGVGEGRFNPDGQITRQEAAVMLRRAAISFGVGDGGTETEFADQSQVAGWATEALGFVVSKGIMSGTGNNMFSPLGTYTREQAYTTMVRIYDVIPVKVSIEGYFDAHPELLGNGAGAETEKEPGREQEPGSMESKGIPAPE